MIRASDIEFAYKGQPPLRFKDLTVEKGKHWLVLGDSGSGKTTFMHILTGLLKPQRGKVSINQTDIYSLSQRELDIFRGKQIGLIFQRPHLLKSLTIAENIQLAQSFAGFPVDTDRITQVLNSLGIASKARNYPSELSQGQLQRASIARAVINKPALLVADEPTSSLDDKNTTSVLELLLWQSELNGSTLLISTHDKRVKQLFNHQYLIG